jgi:hypothetical protein
MIVMNDEKYFTFSHSTLTGMNGFWTDDVENTPDIVKYKGGWQVWAKSFGLVCDISEAGVSTPFIGTVKGQAVELIYSNIYSKWSNSSRNTTKMTKQSFGPIWQYSIMQRKRWNGWSRNTSK